MLLAYRQVAPDAQGDFVDLHLPLVDQPGPADDVGVVAADPDLALEHPDGGGRARAGGEGGGGQGGRQGELQRWWPPHHQL